MSFPSPIESDTSFIDTTHFQSCFLECLKSSDETIKTIAKQVLNKIDEGSSALVYSFKYGGKAFAVKHYNADYQEKKNPSLIREKEISLALPTHPHILQFFFATDELLVMEFVQGNDLLTWVDGPSKDEKTAKIFLRQLVEGLQTIHKQGIVHRDIKHDNILLDTKLQVVKIADFGLARFLNTSDENQPSQKRRLSLAGSPRYTAPEIVKKQHFTDGYGEYDFSVDVWSLGVVAYEMITDELLFPLINSKKDTTRHFQFLQSDTEIEIPNYLATNWQDLLSRMLEKDPEKRISLEEILKHPLFAND